MSNLNTLSQQTQTPLNIFQIDDGYQMAIGDWLSVDSKKFPRGMKVIADQIHQSGMKAGIWLAPFVCEKNSELYRNHPEWIRKDRAGNFLMGGSNWSGFYVLNLQLQEVKDYIRHSFDVVLNEWGYDLVKLDFLYAVCIEPTETKSRGQLMAEGMEFLRECVGDKLILGCGVPLASAFGLVDYCRIGCDVGLDWDDKWFMKWFHRERISTVNAMNNAIGRHPLDGRGFVNDPDVFLLRDENLFLTRSQKKTLAQVNKWFGRLLFTSDDIAKYSSESKELFDWMMDQKTVEIQSVDTLRKGVYRVRFKSPSNQVAYINTSKKTIFAHGVTILPFECVVKEEA